MFITLEGVEGSGKSTHIKKLEKYLVSKDFDVLVTREPGGTPIGEMLRQVLLSPSFTEMLPETELLLYTAARLQIIEQVIKPALNAGKVVISDRFIYSTYAYQGYGRGIPIDTIRRLCELMNIDLLPDITILLDVDIEEGLRRATRNEKDREFKGFIKDRFEMEDHTFHERVQRGYWELAKRLDYKIYVVNTSDSVDKTFKSILDIVKPYLKL